MKKALLLGAGFSYDLGMPLVTDFTEKFLGLFGGRLLHDLPSILAKNKPYSDDRPINKTAIEIGVKLLQQAVRKRERNYEQIVAKYERMEGIANPNQSDRDSYHYLHTFLYGIIHHLLCQFQEASYEVIYPENKKWFSDFANLLSDEETWVFSLNHDLYVECLALDLGIPITYGSIGAIQFPVNNLDMGKVIEFGIAEPDSLRLTNPAFFRQTRGINLIKLHGGLSEFHYKDKTNVCNLTLEKQSSKDLIDAFHLAHRMGYYSRGQRVSGGGADRVVTNMAGELDILSCSMLTGENKFSKTSNPKKGEEKLQLFDSVLQGIEELTVIGYGFGDKHINFRISNALVQNPNLKVRIIDPIRSTVPESLEQFDYDERVGRALCGAAHWMYYSKHKTWNSEQIEALKLTNRVALAARVDEKLMQTLD